MVALALPASGRVAEGREGSVRQPQPHPHPLSYEERGPERASIDEADPGARIDEAVVYSPPAAAVPVEVHLRDEEPAAGIDLLDVRDMARAACALDSWLEDDCRPGCGSPPDVVAA